MNHWTIAPLAFVIAGASWVSCAAALAADPTTGPSASVDAPRSESGPGRGAESKMKRDPHSGTMVPEASPSSQDASGHSSAEESGARQSRMRDMAQVPAGIGERGTGQTQSTLERSGSQADSR